VFATSGVVSIQPVDDSKTIPESGHDDPLVELVFRNYPAVGILTHLATGPAPPIWVTVP